MNLETYFKILEQKSTEELKRLKERINEKLESFTFDGKDNSRAIKEYEKVLIFINNKLRKNKFI